MSSNIKLDLNEGKSIIFDLDIQGVDHKTLKGMFRIEVDGLEYGFPAKVSENKVEVQLPSLKVINKDFKSGKAIIGSKLEMMSENNYYIPWEGELEIVESKSVKAKVSTTKAPRVKAVKTEDEEMDEQQEVIVDDPEPENEVSIPKHGKDKKKKETVVMQNESVLTESTRKEYLNKLKTIDVDGVREYMARAGTKTKAVQDLILEQAEGNCVDPTNGFELLRSVVKVMKKIKSGTMEDGM